MTLYLQFRSTLIIFVKKMLYFLHMLHNAGFDVSFKSQICQKFHKAVYQ